MFHQAGLNDRGTSSARGRARIICDESPVGDPLAGTIRAAMKRADFEFELPPHLIAQRPAERRSASRLLVLDGQTGSFEDRLIVDLPGLLRRNDLLVFNDTRVVPARAFGHKPTGGRVEILLERVTGRTMAWVHLRSSKTVRKDGLIDLPGGHRARLLERDDDLFLLQFTCEVFSFFEAHGQLPLPPYISRDVEPSDQERYQTIFARDRGAVAAPTAGLHFDQELLGRIQERGVATAFITLHVGSGTFAPVREEDLDAHRMHREFYKVPQSTCDAIDAARSAGGRIVAVGTTVVRSLESAALQGAVAPALLKPFQGETQLFIRPGFRFKVVDAMVTNFHLPGSTLLVLCSAFAGRENLLSAYRHAIDAKYRFFSYGDAMFLTPAGGVRERA
jgi:S-adenosylmethionine:tRNA ribosyltransferase-isomerase